MLINFYVNRCRSTKLGRITTPPHWRRCGGVALLTRQDVPCQRL